MSGRPRLWRALLKREFGVPLAALTALVIAAGLLFAFRTASGAAHPSAAPLQLRFDTAVLLIMTVLLVLRTAARTEADLMSGWTTPLFAAGASRTEYGIAVVASAYASSAAVFVTAAVAFALGIRIFGNSSELLAALPRTIGGGVLLLAVHAVCTGLLGLLLRRSIAVVCIVGAAVVVPYVLVARLLLNGAEIPWWLQRIAQAAPPLLLPAGANGIPLLLLQLGVGCVLLLFISHRLAGRQP